MLNVDGMQTNHEADKCIGTVTQFKKCKHETYLLMSNHASNSHVQIKVVIFWMEFVTAYSSLYSW